MITITFIRHGESTDNLKSIWAGWKDAPLSNHGMNQAKACGEFFSIVRFAAIYASPLDRAHTTAKTILAAQPAPHPPLIVSPDLREQYFGIAEGEPWTASADTSLDSQRKVFPVLYGRDEKFPGAESLNELAQRGERAIEEHILPWVWDPEKSWAKPEGDVHIAVVSHGLCISELVAALVRRDANGYGQGRDFKGLVNTGWTRVTVGIEGEDVQPIPDIVDQSAPLTIRVTQVNQHQHLAGIGGIGSTAFDPKQKDIRDFFGGGGVKSSSL